MTQKLAGVLLDIDGTLVDSNDGNARAWFEALLAQGIEISYVKLREAIGMGGDNLLPVRGPYRERQPGGQGGQRSLRGDLQDEVSARSEGLPAGQRTADAGFTSRG